MNAFIRKVANHYKRGGLTGLVSKVEGFTRQKLWSDAHWLIYERALNEVTGSLPAELSHRGLTFEELLDLGYFKALEYPEAIRARCESGKECHGFFSGRQLATMGWSSAGYLELDTDVAIACPGSVGLYDFFTYKEFRSKGYYTTALIQLLDKMGKLGYDRACIAVDPHNSPSRKGIERAGFQQRMLVTRRFRLGIRSVVKEELGKCEA